MNPNFDAETIQAQVAAQLLADPHFATVPVVTVDLGDIQTSIDASLAKLALGVLVSIPNMKVSQPNQPGPYFDNMKLAVIVFENPTLNRTGDDYTTGATLAMVVASVLHQYAPAGLSERIYVQGIEPESLNLQTNTDAIVSVATWTVTLFGKAGIAYAMPQLADVSVSPTTPGDQTVTLTCTQAGAAIFYTLDGSFPSPQNPSASLYTAPISVTAGQLLWAYPWLAGFKPAKFTNTKVQY